MAPQSVFTGITELEPGHVRTVTRRSTQDHSYWSPQYPMNEDTTFSGSIEDAVDETRGSLEEAVRLRLLRADVPVGCYLSGGLDSSLIAALGRRVKGDSFHTYSIRFEEAEYDETPYQRAMAAAIGSEHHEVRASAARTSPGPSPRSFCMQSVRCFGRRRRRSSCSRSWSASLASRSS